MKMVKLPEVCEILDSKRVPVTKSNRIPGPYPYYGANGIQDWVSDYLFDDELVLLAEDGGNFDSDKPIAYRVSGKCWVNNHAHILKAKSNILIDYLYLSLRNYDTTSLTNGATRKKLTQKAMKEMLIPLRKIEDQAEIVGLFSCIEECLGIYREVSLSLDILVKSRFVEMFGDPIENPKKWEIKQLEDVYEIIDGDRGKNYPKSSEFSETGFCLFLNAGNVTKQGFDFSSTQFITKEKDSLLRKGKLKRHDLVVTTRGTVGNIAYYDDYVPYENMRINSGMVILRAKKEIAKEYFVSFFRNPAIYNSLISGTAQPQMPIRSMKNTKMMLPPLFLQQEFAAFVHQVDKLKFETQQSIEKLQMLYDSLAQEYFAPEGD